MRERLKGPIKRAPKEPVEMERPFLPMKKAGDNKEKVFLGDSIYLTYTPPDQEYQRIYDTNQAYFDKHGDYTCYTTKEVTLAIKVDIFNSKGYSYRKKPSKEDDSEQTSLEHKTKEADAFLNVRHIPITYSQRLSSEHIEEERRGYKHWSKEDYGYEPEYIFELDGKHIIWSGQPVFMESAEGEADDLITSTDTVYLCTEIDSKKLYISVHQVERVGYDGDIKYEYRPFTCKDKENATKFIVKIHEHKCKEERGSIYVGNRVAITQTGRYLKNNSNPLIQILDKVIRTGQYPYRFKKDDLMKVVDKVIANDGPENKLMNPIILFEVKQIDCFKKISAVDTFELRQHDNMNAYYLANDYAVLCFDPETKIFFLSEDADISLRVFLEAHLPTEDSTAQSISEKTPFFLRTYQGRYIYWKLEGTRNKYRPIVETTMPPIEQQVYLINTSHFINPFPPHFPNTFIVSYDINENIRDEERVPGSEDKSKLVVPNILCGIFQRRVDTKLIQAFQDNGHNHILKLFLLHSSDFNEQFTSKLFSYCSPTNPCEYFKCLEEIFPIANKNHIDTKFLMIFLKASQVLTQGIVMSHSSSTPRLHIVFSHYHKQQQKESRECDGCSLVLRYGLGEWIVSMIWLPLTSYPYDDVSDQDKQAIIYILKQRKKIMELLNLNDILYLHTNGLDETDKRHQYLRDEYGNRSKEDWVKLLQSEIHKFLACAYTVMTEQELKDKFEKDEILKFFDDNTIQSSAQGMMFKIFVRAYPDLAMTKAKQILSSIPKGSDNDAVRGLALGALQYLLSSSNESNNSDHPGEQSMLQDTATKTVEVYTQLLNMTATKKFRVSPSSTSTYKGFEYSPQAKTADQTIHDEVYPTVTQGIHLRVLRMDPNYYYTPLPASYWSELTDNEIVLTILQSIEHFDSCTVRKNSDSDLVSQCEGNKCKVLLCNIDRDTKDKFLKSLVNCFLSRYDLYRRTHLSQTLLKFILELNEHGDHSTEDLKMPAHAQIPTNLLKIVEVMAEEFPKAISFAWHSQEPEEGYDLHKVYEACCKLTDLIEASQNEDADSKTKDIKKLIISQNLHQQMILLIVRSGGLINYSHIEEARVLSIHALAGQIYNLLIALIHDDPGSAETVWRYKSSLFLLDHWENSPQLNELAANFAWKCITTISAWNYTHSDCELAHSILVRWGAHVTQFNGFKDCDLTKSSEDMIIDLLIKDSITGKKFEIYPHQQDVRSTQSKIELLKVLHCYMQSEGERLKPAYFVKWILDLIAGNTTEYTDVELVTQTARQLLLILKDDELSKDPEIISVLVSEESLNYLIYCTLDKTYESTHYSRTLKCTVLEILCLIFKLDYEKAMTHLIDMLKRPEFSQMFLIFCEKTMVTYIRCLETKNEKAVAAFLKASDANGNILNHLLRFLKILCSNSVWMRDYLSKQESIFKSYNIFEHAIEIVRQTMYTLCAPGVSTACVSALRLILAMIDNKHTINENAIIAERIIHEVNYILGIGTYGADDQFYNLQFKDLEKEELKKEELNIPASNHDISLLKYNCLLILKSIIHREEVDFPNLLSKDILIRNMMIVYLQVKEKKNLSYTQDLFNDLSKTPEENAKNEVLFIENGFLAYFICSQVFKDIAAKEHNIVQIKDKNGFWPECKKLLIDSWFALRSMFSKSSVLLSRKDFAEDCSEEALVFFDQHSSHIELNIENESVTVYFHINPAYIYFNQQEKDLIWYSVGLDDAKTFCTSIKEMIKLKIEELENRERLRNNLLVGQFNKRTKIFKSLTTLFILFINICLMLAFTDRNIDEFEDVTLFELDQRESDAVFKTVGCLILLYFMLHSISNIMLFYWKTKEVKVTTHNTSVQPRHTGKCSESCLRTYNLISSGVKSSVEFTKFMDMWFHLLLIVICILGLAYSELFFSLTLIYVIYITEKIMEVMQAIWIPRHRILYTFILTVIMIYLFGIFALAFLFKDFDANLSGSCNGAFSCFVTIYDQWYKSNLGDYLDNNYAALSQGEDQYNPTFLRIFFDSIVYLILAVLLINIVGGIIIDTFSSIREERESIGEKQHKTCYVCGRINLEIPDFEYHTKFVHNIWDYMYYIGYIKSKKVPETHTERVMMKMIDEDDWTFFPCYSTDDTLVERTMTTMKDEIIKTFTVEIQNLKGDNQKINEKVDKISEEMKSIKTSLEKLIENSARNN